VEAYKLGAIHRLLDLIEDRVFEWPEGAPRPSKIFLDLGKAGWTVIVVWENGVDVYPEGDAVKLILENGDRLLGFAAPDWGELVLLIPPKAR